LLIGDCVRLCCSAWRTSPSAAVFGVDPCERRAEQDGLRGIVDPQGFRPTSAPAIRRPPGIVWRNYRAFFALTVDATLASRREEDRAGSVFAAVHRISRVEEFPNHDFGLTFCVARIGRPRRRSFGRFRPADLAAGLIVAGQDPSGCRARARSLTATRR
jgi:hypothetical protein